MADEARLELPKARKKGIIAAAMKLSSLKIFALKLTIFSAMLAYMGIDLFLWHGPLWRALYPPREAEQEAAAPWVAQVHGERISEAQFQRYVAEQNKLQGRDTATREQKVVMLMDMVRSSLLRLRARYNDKNLPDYAEAAEAEMQRLASRASSPEQFDQWLASQGYDRAQYTRKLQAIMKAAALLQRAVEPLCEVSDEDVSKHYDMLRDELILPENRPLKHIFLATLDQDANAVRAKAQQLLEQLEHGEAEFDELARRHSEDDRTARLGGDLGVVINDGSSPLPELPLFGAEALPAGKPALAQSRWGWHILLPGEITPERPLQLEEVRESLRTAIRSAQSELAVQRFLDEAVRESFHKKHLHIQNNGK